MVSSHQIGILLAEILAPGDFKLVSLKRGQKERDSHPLKSTSAARALNYGTYDPNLMCKKCVHVLSESLDECRVSSWIFTKSPLAEVSPQLLQSVFVLMLAKNSPVVMGRISDILMDPSRGILVVVEVFQVLSSRDKIYRMPVLVRRDSEVTFLIVPAKVNKGFQFSVEIVCSTHCATEYQVSFQCPA
jgi:hypothetical protein